MTTDRELLELAAKVAGIEGEWMQDDSGMPYLHNWENGCVFDPLKDHSDTFKLAVKLMEFEPYKSRGYLPLITADAQSTAKAIVRAAAEIGKAMP